MGITNAEARLLPSLIEFLFDVTEAPEAQITDILVREDRRVVVRTPAGWKPTSKTACREDVHEAAAALLMRIDEFADEDSFDVQSVQTRLIERLQREGPQDAEVILDGRALRLNIALVAPDLVGRRSCLEMVVRVLQAVPLLGTIGLPPPFVRLADVRAGLVVVSGATGSGKSTTVAALLQAIGEDRPVHGITLEDPIEVRLREGSSVWSQKQVGRDVSSFQAGAFQALRQCPDVLMISELRNAETSEAAVYAAQSCLVCTTTHATSALQAISRLRDMVPQQLSTLASVLRGVLALALLPTADGKRFVLASEYVDAAHPEVQNAILKGEFSALRELMTAGPKSKEAVAGLWPMNQRLLKLLHDRAIAPDVAMRASSHPAGLHAATRQLASSAAA